ncbi:DUF6712 family protein [Hymenobacter tenuis]
MATKLILATEIWRHTDVQQNASTPDKFDSRIIRAQEKHLVPILGQVLYELLCDAFEAEAANAAAPMPERFDELHTELVPMLSQWVYYLSLPFLNVDVSRRGLDRSEVAVDTASYNTLSKAVRTEADDRSTDLRKWLEARKDIYPEVPCTPTRRRRYTAGIITD